MKVFLSWSGERSKAVAKVLKEWLPLCIQSLEPWMSAADIDKGARGFEEVETALASANGQGIFCITPENVNAPWLNFEAGVVASKGGKARVCSLLLGLQPADVKPPLSLFQLTKATRDDVRSLVQTLNMQCEKPLQDRVLERAFDANWPELEQGIESALASQAQPAPAQRSVEDSLSELIGITRRVEKTMAEQSSTLRRMRLDPDPSRPTYIFGRDALRRNEVVRLKMTPALEELLEKQPALRNALRVERGSDSPVEPVEPATNLAQVSTQAPNRE